MNGDEAKNIARIFHLNNSEENLGLSALIVAKAYVQIVQI